MIGITKRGLLKKALTVKIGSNSYTTIAIENDYLTICMFWFFFLFKKM